MLSYKKFLTPLFILVTFSQSAEIFIDTNAMSLAQISLSDKYCKQTIKEQKLCQQKSFSYIDFDDSDLPAFLHGLKANLAPVVKKYREDDLKSSTLAEIKDMGGDVYGEWHNASTLTLFAKTEQTYTLSIASDGYTGGAHGYYAIAFENYRIDTQKRIKLKELFLPDTNASLMKVALKHYKEQQGLKPNESLIEDGWFNNTFVLAENFAITQRGLFFHYNSYEIKSYAAGHTEFMLPYRYIRKLIDPDGPLAFALKKKKVTHATFYEKDAAQLDLDVKINEDKTLSITATIDELAYVNQAWFSLSFPQISTKKQILSMHKTGFKKLQAYAKGKKIYHEKLHKAVKAKYLLVEAETKQWKDAKYSMTLTLKVPKGQESLIIDMRANLKTNSKAINIPEYNGVEGQQGYLNYRVDVEL